MAVQVQVQGKPKGVVKVTCKRCHQANPQEDTQQVIYKGKLHWLCKWCVIEAERDGEIVA